ncbi:MAG: helix-turn-helix domain-containing protein [Gammaproteobacteria bacterium]
MTKVHRVETYLSPQHAARIAHLSDTTLRRFAQRGVLTGYRSAGGHRRYALSEIRALKAKLEQQHSAIRARPPQIPYTAATH